MFFFSCFWQLLQDIENEPFTLEEIDFISDESEFVLPTTNIDEVLASMSNATVNTDSSSATKVADAEEDGTETGTQLQKALVLARSLHSQSQENDQQENAEGGEMLALTFKQDSNSNNVDAPDSTVEDGGHMIGVDRQNNAENNLEERNVGAKDRMLLLTDDGETQQENDRQLVLVPEPTSENLK
jgi:hypothetical protein